MNSCNLHVRGVEQVGAEVVELLGNAFLRGDGDVVELAEAAGEHAGSLLEGEMAEVVGEVGEDDLRRQADRLVRCWMICNVGTQGKFKNT